MATPDTEARTALQELLDERQRYHGWLRALEQRRTSTPAHVYERVHTDYTLRLERVMQRLRERAEQLSATIEGMQSRLQTLRSREADRTDERNEYELRAAVGELSPEDWERRRTDADRELAGIAEDRRQIEHELSELQRIVAMTREAPQEPAAPAPEPPTVAERVTEQPVAAESAAAPSEPQRSGGEPRSTWAPSGQPPAGAPTVANAAAAQTNSATSATHDAPTTAGEHPLATGGAASPSIDDFIAEWPLRHMEAEGAGNSTADGNVPSAAPATATWHPPTPNADHAPASVSPPAPAPVADVVPADLHQHHVGDGRRDMDKTLKCPECGAMNYATEWYCERCGGELASF